MEPLIIEYYDAAHKSSPSQRWRWRTRCPENRNILAISSEGYAHKAHCQAMIERHFGSEALERAIQVMP